MDRYAEAKKIIDLLIRHLPDSEHADSGGNINPSWEWNELDTDAQARVLIARETAIDFLKYN